MLAVAATLCKGLRLAAAAALALAVLLASTGMHPTSHCSDHGHGGNPSAVTAAAEPDGAEDGEDDGMCLNCDCTCQTVCLGDALAIQVPMTEVGFLTPADGPVAPDGVVVEVDPPPVRVS